jgi:hypothetical protein
MLGIFRKKMSYEDYGYMCADSILPTLVEQPSQSAIAWAGINLDSEKVARQFAILCLAFFQFLHVELLPDDANQRLLEGVMKRFSERFHGFSSDPVTVQAAADYLRAAAADVKNKSKAESFPTLVPIAISRISGIREGDSHWHSASNIVYSILETLLKTAQPSLDGTKAHARLV